MKNIWVKCHVIEWFSNDESLPHSINEMVIAPEWVVGDNYNAALSEAIYKRLEEEYHVIARSVCFSTYDDNEARELDLKLLTGCCHK